jgi:hypothetical protein
MFESLKSPWPQPGRVFIIRVSKNFLTVGRLLVFHQVILETEEEARRFLSALQSNDKFAVRNPGWPRMNSTRSIELVSVISGFTYLVNSQGETACQILRNLPKLEELIRRGFWSRMSVDELSAVSDTLKNLKSRA